MTSEQDSPPMIPVRFERGLVASRKPRPPVKPHELPFHPASAAMPRPLAPRGGQAGHACAAPLPTYNLSRGATGEPPRRVHVVMPRRFCYSCVFALVLEDHVRGSSRDQPLLPTAPSRPTCLCLLPSCPCPQSITLVLRSHKPCPLLALNCTTIISVAIIHSCVHHHVQAAPSTDHAAQLRFVLIHLESLRSKKSRCSRRAAAPHTVFLQLAARQRRRELEWPQATL
mmetsp:Transcript_31358/g.99967  ORF Transcript_31358/g.99967 Transcript_31358/m.99967 type:complete len:227 (-) Transcript_31358:58-738(-)